ncbi:MAG TPA: heavy metal translocating P-type ATPase [Terracidiphilus sp.]|nr:heavy metal translocating P-type ATPase [Terracidiphilus sp.]
MSSTLTSHGAVAAFMAVGMIAVWGSRYILRNPEIVEPLLVGLIILASIPLCVELVRQISNRNFSVDILAFLAIVTALVLRQHWVAAIVIVMLSGGKALEDYAIRRASSVLGALARRMPQIAHRVEADGAIKDLPLDAVAVEEKLIIYPHELCPVDGIVLEGTGAMDESYLTGEPFVIAKAPGAAVLSGAINGEAALTIRATRVASDSRYAKIIQVLHESEKNRPRIRRLGDRLGLWYTPVALGLAVLSWIVSGEPERFLAVIVIATPCPLLLAIPIAIIGAISVGARRGIVIKEPSVLEKIDSCRTLVVDKTGTLTYGKPQLTEIVCANRWARRSLLQFAASLERYSKHPLASAVLKGAEEEGVPLIIPENVSESPGHGLTGQIEGHKVTITGRGKLRPEVVQPFSDLAMGLECVIMIDGELAGLMRFHDQPRHDSKHFLSHIESRHGFNKIVLLSGDRPSEVNFFASEMGISEVYGGKSPEEKVTIVREIASHSQTLFLGDGINDAPAMMNATAGVALGVNSDITSEAASAVILQSSLASVDELIHIGRRMRRIAMTSAVGGMLLSVIGMAAGALGFLAPIEGAILQEFIDLLSILNSLRMILPTGPLSDFTVPASSTYGAVPKAQPIMTTHV